MLNHKSEAEGIARFKKLTRRSNTVDERIFDIVPNTTFFNAEVKEWHI